MATRTLKVEIIGDDRSLSKALNRSEKKMGKFGAVAKKAGLGLAGGFAAGGVVAFKEAREAAKVGRQTEAVLKSTGGAAKVTKKDIEGLADSISMKTAVDDEAIQSAENLLLTFTRVRNETGRGNKIFSQATTVITDMSAALGQDMKSSTIQVGKALQDPIRGITALRRVGVAFTDQQQAQIKAMVASGDQLGAQKLILKELKTEFGGSAAAQADGLDKMKAAFNRLMEVLGGPLFTALSSAGNAMARFLDQFQKGEGAGGRFATTMTPAFNTVKAVVASAVTYIGGFLHKNRADIRAVGSAFMEFGRGVLAVFNNIVLPVIRRVGPGIRQIMGGWIRMIGGIIRVLGALMQGDFRGVFAGIRTIFSGALKTLGGVLRAGTAPFREIAARAGQAISGPFRGAWTTVRRVFSAGVGASVAVLRTMTAPARAVAGAVGAVLRNTLGSAVQGAARVFRSFGDVARHVWNRVKAIVSGAVNAMLTPFRRLHDLARKVRDLFRSIGGAAKGLGNAAKGLIDKIPVVGDLVGAGRPIGGAKGSLGKYEGIAHRFGLTTTSGFRPGDPGWHGKNRARDVSGPPNKMMAFARHVAARYGKNLLELIYTPMGFSIDNGRRTAPFAQADHYDHVHIAARHGRRTSERATKPTVHFAEEAPRHPEYYISTNPRDRSRSMGLLSQAAEELSGKRLAHFRHGGRTGQGRRLGGIPGIFARAVRGAGLKGRMAKVIFEAMLRANAVEAGAVGRNPTHGDRDSLGVFQIRGMHGSAKNRMNPMWSANWFIRNAKTMYRKGISAGELAANVERPAAQYRGRYGQVPAKSLRGLMAAFGGGKGGPARGRKRRGAKKKRAPKGSAAARWQEQLEAHLAMAGLTPGMGDDIAAQTRLTGFLGGQYREALKSKRPSRIKEAAEAYKGGLDALQTLREEASGGAGGATDANQALVDAANAQAEAIRAQTEAINGMRAELRERNNFAKSVAAVTSFEAVRVVADMISGHIGGITAQRGLTAGDGKTLALT